MVIMRHFDVYFLYRSHESFQECLQEENRDVSLMPPSIHCQLFERHSHYTYYCMNPSKRPKSRLESALAIHTKFAPPQYQ